MKDAFFFRLGYIFDRASDWAFQKVSDTYLTMMESQISGKIDYHMHQMGMTKVTIYHVNVGPIHRDSIPDDEGLPDGVDWLLEVKCRIDNDASVVDIPLWFTNFNEAYDIVSHFYADVEPKVIYISRGGLDV